ncbi:hypothetical protein [Escherichia coli]|uniref:hypothetical protein n=1 Tax=Escherichia coli TaxID=562 RepID=UPI000CFD46FB|nr:hypothetical protein [Escherichia coli]
MITVEAVSVGDRFYWNFIPGAFYRLDNKKNPPILYDADGDIWAVKRISDAEYVIDICESYYAKFIELDKKVEKNAG